MADKPKAGPRERRRALRALRKQVGLSLQELADLCGLHVTMISKWELGHRALSPESFERVKDVLAKVRIKKLAERVRATQTPEEYEALRAEMTESENATVWAYIETEHRALAEKVPQGALHRALGVPDDRRELEAALERSNRELERWQRKLLALDAALDDPEKHIEIVERGYDEKSGLYTATSRFTVPPYEGPIDQETFDIDAVNNRIDEKIRIFQGKIRERGIEQRRKLAALENLQSIDDPIISELIESFRREIAEKDKQLEALSRTLEKNGRAATN